MTASTPEAAAPAERETATFPVEAQLTVLIMWRIACSRMSAVALSLFEPVGVRVSSFNHNRAIPVVFRSRGGAIKGVFPIARGYRISSSSIGSKFLYRHIPSLEGAF